MNRSEKETLPLDELRRTLLQRRRELLESVLRTEEDRRWLDENFEPEIVEEGQEETIARLLARLEDHEREEIEAIDRALQRIELGDYGICSGCGRPIPVERLKILPATDLCVDCARQKEMPH